MKLYVLNYNFKSKRRSFTLIEMTTVIGILALIITVTTGVLISVVKAYDKQRVIAEIQRNGDFAIRVIEENLRNATTVTCVDRADPATPINCESAIEYDSHLLKIVDEDETFYVGRAEREADNLCGSRNHFVFYTEDPDNPVTNTYQDNSLTNHGNTGVDITDFEYSVNDSSGLITQPTRVMVTITISDSVCGTNWKNESRSFQTFVTVRGSY